MIQLQVAETQIETASECAEAADAQDEDLQMVFSTVRCNDQLE